MNDLDHILLAFNAEFYRLREFSVWAKVDNWCIPDWHTFCSERASDEHKLVFVTI